MNEIHTAGKPLVDALRRYVLQPLCDAQSLVRREYEEIQAERRAFQCFKERVSRVDTVSPSTTPTHYTTAVQPYVQRVDCLRSAYRETIMGVSHYEDVYGESLEKNIEAEFSTEVAAGLQHNGIPFTQIYKKKLNSDIDRAVARRRRICESIKKERDFIEKYRQILIDLVMPLDGPRIPAWHVPEFETELAKIAERRQEILRTCFQAGRLDGHEMCAYLYKDQEWSYPVLIAVARLRGAVEYPKDSDQPATTCGISE